MAVEYFLPNGAIVNESGTGACYFLPNGAIFNEPRALAVASITADHDMPFDFKAYAGSAIPKQYFLPSGDVINDPGDGGNYFFGRSIFNGSGIVTVQAITAISVLPTSVTIARGATQNFAVVDQNGAVRSGVTVASSDTSIATVSTPNDSFGVSVATASGSTSGTTTLTFAYNNGTTNLTATATLIVQSVATISGNGTIPLSGTAVTTDHSMPISHTAYSVSAHDLPWSFSQYTPNNVRTDHDMPLSFTNKVLVDAEMPFASNQYFTSAQMAMPFSTGTTAFVAGNIHVFDVLPRI